PALVPRCPGELGDRALRVPAAGAGESHRLRRDDVAAAQGRPGSDYAARVRAVRHRLHEAAHALGLRLGGIVPPGGSVLRVPPEVTRWGKCKKGRIREDAALSTCLKKLTSCGRR